MRRETPNIGSINYQLSKLEISERIYTETTLDDYKKDMRKFHTGKARRGMILEGRKFSTSLITGVVSGKAGTIRYLICLERTM